MGKVPAVTQRKVAFPCLITEMATKAELEWQDDNYLSGIPSKEKFIPYGNWLKEELLGSRKCKCSASTAADQPSTSAPTASQPQYPETKEFRFLEQLKRMERRINRRYKNIKLQIWIWEPMLEELDTPKERSEDEDEARADGVEGSPSPQHDTDHPASPAP
ncbi:uncharacterized protein LOC107634616 [Arachis ipaensis]|uniref:uncharacterized protein LOC107634616 n=1 Tax=Arachis ipaensis TaxID=130454 RepID=UPI0007AF909E|nr:uncharacterized protein LOC107634616 [Arachis ipaensis]XP_016193523.1 uncharacterized protein LOC107634616 [Arachis ipaensis]QHO02355.1 uncharacterized protein DS421_13g423050 [Arachis hypogaea]